MAILPDDVTKAAAPAPYAAGDSWIEEAEAADAQQPRPDAIKTGSPVTDQGQQPPANEEGNQTKEQSEARGLIDHLPAFSLDRMRKLRAQMGDALDLGIHFYTRDGAPEEDKYKRRQKPLTFWGINILSARTSGGKTLMLKTFCNYLLHMMKDYHAVFFSLEEAELDIEEALLSGYLWHEESFPTLPPDGMTARGVEAITTDDIHEYIKDTSTLDADQGERLNAAARDLRERLHIISLENLEEAALSFAGDLDEKHAAIIRDDPPRADYSNVICALIDSYFKKYTGKVVFFIDYVQRIHHKDGEGNASYKELQRVMNDLMSAARTGAIIFLAAQSNRTVATGTAAGHAEKGSTREATEYFNVFGEQLREAADLEQGANKIIYSVIDRANNAVNLRLTKARRDEREQFAAVPVFWGVQSARLDQIKEPTLKHEQPKPKQPKGDSKPKAAPAKEKLEEKAPEELTADEQALIDLSETGMPPSISRSKRR